MKAKLEKKFIFDLNDLIDNPLVSYERSNKKYITDAGISLSHMDVQSIFISSQCGSGKTTWMENEIEELLNYGYKIGVFSDRISNNRQLKRRVAQKLGYDYLLKRTDEELDMRGSFGDVSIMTYQKLFKRLSVLKIFEKNLKSSLDKQRKIHNKMEELELLDFDYIFFDECQAYASDSFNNSFPQLMDEILNRYKNSKKIYLTATPEPVFNLVLNKEIDKIQESNEMKIRKLNFCYSNQCFAHSYKFKVYEFERNYKFIENFGFFENMTGIKILFEKYPNESTITFVDSIKQGIELQRILGDDSIFFSSESVKNSEIKKIYDEMLRTERCDYQHIIATTVIVDGVNLKDNRKIVCIALNNFNDIIQAVGRRRILDEKDRIHIYFKYYSKRELYMQYEKFVKSVEFINQYYKNYDYFLLSFNEDKGRDNGLFYISDNSKVEINEFAEYEIIKYFHLYKELLSEYDSNPYLLLKKKIELFSKKRIKISSDMNVNSEMKSKLVKEFELFLKENLNREMNDSDYRGFCRKFKELYTKAYGKRKEDNASRDSYGITIINKCLKELNLQLKLSSCKGIKGVHVLEIIS